MTIKSEQGTQFGKVSLLCNQTLNLQLYTKLPVFIRFI